jgi:hypothetical protein
MPMLLKLACQINKVPYVYQLPCMKHFFVFVGNLFVSTYGREIEQEVVCGSLVSVEHSGTHSGVDAGWRPAPPPRCSPSCSCLPAA